MGKGGQGSSTDNDERSFQSQQPEVIFFSRAESSAVLLIVYVRRPQTACSLTSSLLDLSSSTKTGMAPCSITTRVCFDVPEAMLVRAHADSN